MVPLTNTGPTVLIVDPSVHEITAEGTPSAISAAHSTTSSAGQVITGGSLAMVKVCVHMTVLPHSSSAVYTISYIAPGQSASPLTRAGVLLVIVTDAPQLVVAIATPAMISAAHSTTASAGHVSTGGSGGSIVIVLVVTISPLSQLAVEGMVHVSVIVPPHMPG